MADTTINLLSELSSIAADDKVPIWDTSAAQYLYAQRSKLVGATLTGDGTIATAGYTLTLPATGTAALISAGTWDPALKIGGAAFTGTYAANSPVGTYTKIGTLCHIRFTMSLATLNSQTGTLTITGLPFTANGTVAHGINPHYLTGMASITGQVMCYIAATGATLNLVQMGATGHGVLTHANLSTSTAMVFSGVYEVA